MSASRPCQPVAVALAVGLAAALVLGGCGRSAPPGALRRTSPTNAADPEIAGVSVTSPGTVATVPPAAATVTSAPATSTYTVRQGDTLSQIAIRFGVTTQALADANGITDVKSVKAGQQLTIPPATKTPRPDAATAGPSTTAAAGTGSSGSTATARPSGTTSSLLRP